MTEEAAKRPAAAGAKPGSDWLEPRPEKIPAPTYWPVVMAFGSTLLLWGFVSTWIISGVGLALVVLALAGWIGAIRHDA